MGLGPTYYFRSLGINGSLYIDEHLVRKILAPEGLCLFIGIETSQVQSPGSLFCGLGYFLGWSKCVLEPTTWLKFLGMVFDQVKFAELRRSVLSKGSTIPLKSIQKLIGKCISFSLAFPGAKFYIREMGVTVGQASRVVDVTLSPTLREEIEFWHFLDGWQDAIPWIQESHMFVLIVLPFCALHVISAWWSLWSYEKLLHYLLVAGFKFHGQKSSTHCSQRLFRCSSFPLQVWF